MSDSSAKSRPARSGRFATRLLVVAVVAVLTATALLAGRASLNRAERSADGGDTRGGPTATAAPDAPAAGPAASSAVPSAPVTPGADRAVGNRAAAGVAARVASRPVSVRYTFDGGAGRPVVDTTGRYPLLAAVGAGGVVGFRRRDGGWAVTLRGRCSAEPANCPRSILEGVRADELNPGTRPVRLGASVRMTPADTSEGANVVQKGYSVGGGTQIKLQVDGRAGRPSCVVAGATRIHRVIAPVRIADGDWHQLTCVRSGATLTIMVDGVARGSVSVPARLSIVNPEPLRVGGKGVNPGNDQYSGQLDDVFLIIS